MDNLQPLTDYKIIAIQVAAPAILDDDEITGGLNEMLREACATLGSVVAGWQFLPTAEPEDREESEYQIRGTGEVPEEGELFGW